MPKQIDHIVILVRDLTRAVDAYRASGFKVTPGGEHTMGGTHNSLIGFADGTYLELIAFRDPSLDQEHRWWSRLADGEGFVDYALLSDDLAVEAAELRSRGLEVGEPGDGGRLRPDGQRIAWRNLMVADVPCESGQPFLIQDVTPRQLRVPSGHEAQHPRGVTRVAGLTLVVGDLAVAAGRLGALLDDDGRLSVGGDGDRMLFTVGSQWLELLQPGDAGSEAGGRLAAFGDSPYELVLTTSGEVGPGQGELIAMEMTHGARIRVVR